MVVPLWFDVENYLFLLYFVLKQVSPFDLPPMLQDVSVTWTNP